MDVAPSILRRSGKWTLQRRAGRLIVTDGWHLDYIVVSNGRWLADRPERIPLAIKVALDQIARKAVL